MAKILHFPTELVRDWTEWETTIREILDEAKASPGMTDEVCRAMKEVHREYSCFRLSGSVPLPFPATMPPSETEPIVSAVREVINKLSSLLTDFSSQVMFDRLMLEIQLYQLRHPDG